MRGSTGAIEKVVVDSTGQVGNLSYDGRLRINVIGNARPAGLCGSGLIDAAAELLRHGLLTPQGRLQTPDQLLPNVLPDLARRVVLQAGQVSFLLRWNRDGRRTADRPTQQDLRELQLAAGAIRAGIVILLRRAGLEPKDLDRVLIGGGFGNFIRATTPSGSAYCQARSSTGGFVSWAIRRWRVLGLSPSRGRRGSRPKGWPAAPNTWTSRPTPSSPVRLPRR